ncbi:phage portal protein [Amycolatopsis sp. NPDC051373]|uniref:phage portal protein n=1 Tax=Amycolatopsis sp. NPDC051373 TaxID=3155801 RepID=UPI00344CBB52
MTTDLGVALDAMAAAAPGYQKAVAYSEGPVHEVFASRRMRRLLFDKRVNFQALLGDVIIDAVANKLKITAITSDSDDRTALIAKVDEDNSMALVRPAVMRRALQQGDSYLSAWPVLDDNGDPVPGKVCISVHDARTARIIYDDENPTQPKFGIQRWKFGKRVRVDLCYEDRIEHYLSSVDGSKAMRPTDFEPYAADGRDAVEANPYGQIPLHHFHGTGLPGEYGEPEHKSFYGTQDTLLKLKIGHMSSVDYHALPQRWALREAGSDTAESADLDPDDFATVPEAQFPRNRIDKPSTLSSEPGSIWDLMGIKQVGEFPPADPKAFLDPREAYLREGALVSSTPLYMFDRTGQIPSGESLKTANAPLDDKAGARKTSFDGTWRGFYSFVLKLLGEDDAPVTLAWAPIESTDETTKLSQAKQKQELGVPVGHSLVEAGYKAADVEDWLDSGDGGLPQKVELLAQLGSAVRDLSTAVAAGVLDKSTVDAIVSQLIGDLSDDHAA